MVRVKKEPLEKTKVNKTKSPKATPKQKIANTPTKTKPKPPKNKDTQDENMIPAAPTAQQSAKQSEKKNTAVVSVDTPVDVSDHAALLARIRELEQHVQQHSGHLQNKPKLISDPGGTAGSHYNLQTMMGLGGDDRTYTAIRRGVRAIADKSGMDYRLEWGKQPKELVGRVFRVARNRFPFLGQFVGDWATRELAKARMKNRRAYCVRQGYNQTDFGMDIDRSFDDDEGGADEGEAPGQEDEFGDGHGTDENEEG